MLDIINYLWLVPTLPLVAAGVLAITPRRHRQFAAGVAIGSMGLSFILACIAFGATLNAHEATAARHVHNFTWFELGPTVLKLGWVLDPLSACMLLMVTLVGTLIFIYSVGYMASDENFTRFFSFLSLFAAAMLGVVMANSLLLLFIGWELMGLASYLLIGFWFHKPSAAAAAKKAFIVTRIGDMGLFVGMLWLYAQTGTLLFYDGGSGCLESSALATLVTQTTLGGMAVATAIALLIFCGAIGKSGQVPLHVWLPDAMEGPTPVSALIHAATMVAAGVFLVARVYPLMEAHPLGVSGHSTALTVVTWVGAITAVFAASIAVAQNDIKRILAYSTVSQLGYMMLGIGVGGYAVGMFHLVTHAFFKALLFLGAGSVIHGCGDEQDIRRLGGLRRLMPVTFATYAIGMMALSGVPLLFSGFWSKDEILHSAFLWSPSRWPFYLGVFGAFLTALYMTRQMCYVFFGNYRGSQDHQPPQPIQNPKFKIQNLHPHSHHPHESPSVLTIPLIILATSTVLLSLIGTPFWPWFHAYITGHLPHLKGGFALTGEVFLVMSLSVVIVGLGIGLGWWFYGRKPVKTAAEPDPLQVLQPDIFALLRSKYLVDELYEATVVRLNTILARASVWLDQFVWGGLVQLVAWIAVGVSWVNRLLDEFVVNLGFDRGCGSIRAGAEALSLWQNGRVQRYLRALGLGLILFAVIFIWGCRS